MAKIKSNLPDDHRLAQYRGETGSLQSNISDNPEKQHFDHEFIPDNIPGIFFFVNADEIETAEFEVDAEYLGEACVVGDCEARVLPGDEWGENWTTDDGEGLYCADHNYVNPTSDNFTG